MLDHAVIVVGNVIENALQETIRIGSDDRPRYEAKYRLDQLLDPAFRLPVEDRAPAPDLEKLSRIPGLIVD